MSFINTRDAIGDQATLDGLVAHTLEELREDGVSVLGSYALFSNSGLRYVEMPGLSSGKQGASAFAYCSSLQSVVMQNLSIFSPNMFAGCSSLTDVSAPNAFSAFAYTFVGCTSLPRVSFPNMRDLGTSMFQNCYRLSEALFASSVSRIGESVFANCFSLQSASFDSVKTIEGYAFYQCRSLKTAAFPAASSVAASAFQRCSMLTSVSFPSVSYVGSYAFDSAPIWQCILPNASYIGSRALTSATTVDLGAQVTLNGYTFTSNIYLFALILRNASIATLQSAYALQDTPIQAGYGKIYVPNNLVSAYRSATNWAAFSSQIASIDSYTDSVPLGGDTITDDWATILSNSNYATDYSIGDTKWLKTAHGYILMQIAAFDTDELADNTGFARITWISKGHQFKSSGVPQEGWTASAIYNLLYDNVLPTIDATVLDEIKTVKKTYSANYSTYTSEDDIWIPSVREVCGAEYATTYGHENSGCDYTALFPDQNARRKYLAWSSGSGLGIWALRTARLLVDIYGGIATGAGADIGVVFGFCT